MNYLRRARELAGLSLYEMPTVAPVSVVAMAHCEAGISQPSVELLAALIEHPRFHASAAILALHALLASGLSARQVARSVGVDDSDVAQWRVGKRLVPKAYEGSIMSGWRALRDQPRASPPAHVLAPPAVALW